MSWKKNFLKIPSKILIDVKNIDSDFIVVAASKRIPVEDLAAGTYSHLGLTIAHGEIQFQDVQYPDTNSGKYSKRNLEGWEVVRKDLPKITKTFYWESPNFGDAATYGSSMRSREREVYQREYHEPRMHELQIELINSPVGEGGTYLIKFQITEVLDRNRPDFTDRLFFALNLLQENTGVAAVYRSDVTNEEFQRMTSLDWEVFPEGTADIVIESISRRVRPPSIEKQAKMRERIEMFNAMRSRNIMIGSGGFGTYIGAEFADDLVVFENVNYGNALYILYENWEETSQKSRIDLLRGTDDKYYRIVHTQGWEDRFKKQMRDELRSRGIRLPHRGRFF